jgi:hypothetical protein
LGIVDRFWQTTPDARDRHRVATLKYGGFQMFCDLSEMLRRQFYVLGTYFLEEDVLACWQVMAKGATVVLDLGANAGFYSLAASRFNQMRPSTRSSLRRELQTGCGRRRS